MSERVKCVKCGFENPSGMKFCGNCGAKLVFEELPPESEALTLLHLTGSLYLVMSLVFNSLARASPLFVALYTTSALLGLYAAYSIRKQTKAKHSKIVSVMAIIAGFSGTLLLFIIGLLELRGIVGPAWIIFLISGYMLWKNREKI